MKLADLLGQKASFAAEYVRDGLRDVIYAESYPFVHSDRALKSSPTLTEWDDQQLMQALCKCAFQGQSIAWPDHLQIPKLRPYFDGLAAETEKTNKEYRRVFFLTNEPGVPHQLKVSNIIEGSYVDVVGGTQMNSTTKCIGDSHSHPHKLPPGIGAEFFSPKDMEAMKGPDAPIFEAMICGKRLLMVCKSDLSEIPVEDFDRFMKGNNYELRCRLNTPAHACKELCHHFGLHLYLSDRTDPSWMRKVLLDGGEYFR